MMKEAEQQPITQDLEQDPVTRFLLKEGLSVATLCLKVGKEVLKRKHEQLMSGYIHASEYVQAENNVTRAVRLCVQNLAKEGLLRFYEVELDGSRLLFVQFTEMGMKLAKKIRFERSGEAERSGECLENALKSIWQQKVSNNLKPVATLEEVIETLWDQTHQHYEDDRELFNECWTRKKLIAEMRKRGYKLIEEKVNGERIKVYDLYTDKERMEDLKEALSHIRERGLQEVDAQTILEALWSTCGERFRSKEIFKRVWDEKRIDRTMGVLDVKSVLKRQGLVSALNNFSAKNLAADEVLEGVVNDLKAEKKAFVTVEEILDKLRPQMPQLCEGGKEILKRQWIRRKIVEEMRKKGYRYVRKRDADELKLGFELYSREEQLRDLKRALVHIRQKHLWTATVEEIREALRETCGGKFATKEEFDQTWNAIRIGLLMYALGFKRSHKRSKWCDFRQVNGIETVKWHCAFLWTYDLRTVPDDESVEW
ncbi:MAG: hypothetical protein QXD45_05945 [Candidatus Bathyarchaeia archaeon]